jgi:hypothetical protein
MSTIEDIKSYVETPDGLDWFLKTMNRAHERQRRLDDRPRSFDTITRDELNKRAEETRKRYQALDEAQAEPVAISRAAIEEVIKWNREGHPREEGTYQMFISRQSKGNMIRLLLMKPGHTFNGIPVSGNLHDILSGELTRFRTKDDGGQIYNIILTD